METVAICGLCRGREIEQLDPECHFCRCGSCGYVFDSPRPTADEIAAFYSQKNKYDAWLAAERARDALWKRRLKKLLPHRAPGNLLDVGAGTGQFLHHARPHFTDVHGTEISESAIRIAKERYGLELLRGTLEAMELARASYDNITLFHVLEHVPDPAGLAEKCRELLRMNGTLVVAVPNDVLAWTSSLKKAGRRLGLKPFRKFSKVVGISGAGSSREIHLSHFTPAVLRRLLEGAGFDVLEEGLDPYYASNGLRRITHGMYYALHRGLLGLSGVNRYDTIWMAARKREAREKSGARPESAG